MFIRRVMIAVLSAVVLALSVLGGAAPASAADLGTIQLVDTRAGTYPDIYELQPATISGNVGDSFEFRNATSAFAETVQLINGTGAIKNGNSDQLCVTHSCYVAAGSSVNFVIVQAGTIQIRNGSNVLFAVLTIAVGGASGPTDPALVYPTATLDPNGGICTGTLQFTKYNNQNGTITTPTSATCTRAQYTLAGWARSASSGVVDFAAGTVVPIGDESFTLYAVWSPIGAEITYDSNVGDVGQCVNSSGVNVAPGLGRVSTTVTTTTLASAAPCRPENKDLVLSGWATSGKGPVAYKLGESLTDAKLANGSKVRLFAVWQPTLTVTCIQGRALPLWTFSCTDFGDVPVGWEAVISVVVSTRHFGAHTLVAQPLDTANVNGTLVAKPKEGDCSAAVKVPTKGSCTLHYSWTPERAGSLSSGTTITVCRDGNPNNCYRTALNDGLRGNASGPVVNTYGVSISGPAGLTTGSSATATVTATLNGAPAANVQIAIATSGAVSLAGGAMKDVLTTNSQGQVQVTLTGSTSPGAGILTASFGDKSTSKSIDVAPKPMIIITGSRLASDNRFISAEGVTTGLADDSTVIPYIRFPGETSYTAGVARPVILSGEFTWQRKTGKRVSVYFMSGDVRSNTIVIEAR
jgi:Listeria-Bacteroides repeat domain (List_Bact_rpt)